MPTTYMKVLIEEIIEIEIRQSLQARMSDQDVIGVVASPKLLSGKE